MRAAAGRAVPTASGSGRVTGFPFMSSAPFDRLYSRAVPLLLRGEQLREEPPVEGGRWPVSVVLPPDPAAVDDG